MPESKNRSSAKIKRKIDYSFKNKKWFCQAHKVSLVHRPTGIQEITGSILGPATFRRDLVMK